MSRCSTLLLFALLAAPASAHGGIYVPPGDAGGSEAPGKPGGPGAPKAPGVGAPQAPTGPNGSTPGTPGATNRPQGRPGAPQTDNTEQPFAWDSWVFWWEYNKDRFLTLRDRLAKQNTAVTGGIQVLTRIGRHPVTTSARRPSADEIVGSVLPALRALLARETDRDILDSCVLALARTVDDARGSDVDVVAPLLAHPELSVQSAAALALGVLGARQAVPLLIELSADTAAGRQAVGGGAVPAQVRSFAILGLGLCNDPKVIDHLANLARRLPDSERDLRVAAVTAIGLLPEEARERGIATLNEILGDRRADAVVRAQVPVALARLGATEDVARLIEAFVDRDTDDMIRQSIAIALGRLGNLARPEVATALLDCVEQGRDAHTRHFALMALAELGVRDAEADASERHPQAQADLAAALARQIARPSFREQRAWAGLAAAIHGRAVPEVAPDAIEALRAGWRQAKDPLDRGAFGLGLGLLVDHGSSDELFAAFGETRDETLKGHLGLALGFLGHEPAREPLRALCAAKTTPPTLRLQAATALGLLSDEPAVPVLVSALQDAQGTTVASACARSLGLIGDRKALPRLLDLAQDARRSSAARAFSCVALGLLCERGQMPWHARLRRDVNYRARSPVLDEILDIL